MAKDLAISTNYCSKIAEGLLIQNSSTRDTLANQTEVKYTIFNLLLKHPAIFKNNPVG